MEERTFLTAEEFLKHLKRTTPNEEGEAVIENVRVAAPEGKPIGISLEELPWRMLSLHDCVLPEVDFVGRAGSESNPAPWVELRNVSSPHLRFYGAFEDVSISNAKIGVVTCTGMDAPGYALYLHGAFDKILLYAALKSVTFNSVRTNVLRAYCHPCVSKNQRDADDNSVPLTVHNLIDVSHPGWARFLQLLCPTTPIYFVGNMADL